MNRDGKAIDRVVLIGMMGSGKSTVGSLLARRLGWRYVDNDDDVRLLTAQEPTDVMTGGGEDELHAAEASALLRALGIEGPVVIGAAAWVVLDNACEQALHEEPCVIYLRARPETLRQRIGSGAGRRSDATDLGWLRARHRERDVRYRRLATSWVDVDDHSPDGVVGLIMEHAGLTDVGRSPVDDADPHP